MIELNNVTFRHNEAEKTSVRDLSLCIPDGQCVLLCGESGSGKTTVTRLINGLIPHYYEGEMTGTVMVDGLNVTESELYETARHVGSVFQNPRSQFFCVDTTSEIAFGCENMGMPEDEILMRIENAAREIKVTGLLDRSIFELSGGEKQKIACASVSALHPDIFVLDEPTSNLDMKAIADLKQILLGWKAEGKTIVIAEHRLVWLLDICDRVVYMADGEIKQDMSMSEFQKIPPKKLHQMGLRPLTMEYYDSETEAWTSSETVDLFGFQYGYDTVSVIDIDELHLPKGGVIAVIGHNGAGKSTFCRCLCGLEKKFKGHAVINGKRKKNKQLLKECYMVMQDVNHQLFCETVEEEVQLGMEEENAACVQQVLNELDLSELVQRHPMSLSGGQKQRVAIASAMLAEKSVLIFDEPTSGLDQRHMEQTASLIASLKDAKTSLVITHDLELILRSCSHVLHIEQGKAVDLYPINEQTCGKLYNFFM